MKYKTKTNFEEGALKLESGSTWFRLCMHTAVGEEFVEIYLVGHGVRACVRESPSVCLCVRRG